MLAYSGDTRTNKKLGEVIPCQSSRPEDLCGRVNPALHASHHLSSSGPRSVPKITVPLVVFCEFAAWDSSLAVLIYPEFALRGAEGSRMQRDSE